MTPLDKNIYRVTRTAIRDGRTQRPIVLGLGVGDVVSVRLKGTRRSYALPALHIYYQAVKLHAQAERARKMAERKSRR
jgi:hypothetical protein